MNDSKAALRQRAEDYVYQRSPYQKWLWDEKRNRQAFEVLVANPAKVAQFYVSFAHADGQLERMFPGFAKWSPQERLVRVTDNLAHLYERGMLGAVFPIIVKAIREAPEKFGHASREAFEAKLGAAGDEVRSMAAEMDRLETVETLALRAVEADLAAGRTPAVFADAPAGPPSESTVRDALETAVEVHRPPDSGAAADRDAIREGLRDGSLTQDEALGLVLQLDREAVLRGEVRPYVPQNSRELAVKQANRLHEIRAALAAGEPPPPVTEFIAQKDGLTPAFAPPVPSGPRAFDLRDAEYARRGVKGLPLRDALSMAYETVHKEETGSYSPDLTGEPTDEDLARDAEAGARIDAGKETLRDVVEGAWDIAAPRSPAVEPRAATRLSTREALDAAWAEQANSDSSYYDSPSTAPSGESLRATLERAAANLED